MTQSWLHSFGLQLSEKESTLRGVYSGGCSLQNWNLPGKICNVWSLQSEVHETHRNHIPIHFVKEHEGVLIAFIKSKRVFRKLQTNNILKINLNCPSNFFFTISYYIVLIVLFLNPYY